VVEVEGARTLLPACATPAAANQVIQTESPRVAAARRMVLELALASGNHNCLICEANGECELQALAYRYQVPYPAFATPPDHPYYFEDNNSMIVRDFSKCIMCGRCVRGCTERQVNDAIAIGYRGSHNKIVAKADKTYIESDCVFCGECVQSCPVGALLDKNALGQGRAWERTKVLTTCPYCGVGCQLEVHVKDDRIVKVTGADLEPNNGRLCVKGRFGWHFVHHPERLTTPLLRKNGELTPVSWDEALEVHAGGPRHQPRGPLRPSLTQRHCGRSGRFFRFRRHDQLHRRVGGRGVHSGHRLQHQRKPPGHRRPHQTGGALQGRQSHRGGPEAPGPGEVRQALSAAYPGDRYRPPQRHDARHHP
jgi:predicted molibdopterin-dependent oxidoreductase YjgC